MALVLAFFGPSHREEKKCYTRATGVRFNIPDELAVELVKDSSEISEELLSREMQLRALAGFVEAGLLTSGRAAELAAMTRVDFLDWCGARDLTIYKYSQEDLDRDLLFAGVEH